MCICVTVLVRACVCACVRVRVMGSGVGNINACDLVIDPMYMKLVLLYLQINLHIYSYSVLWEMPLLHMFSFSQPILSYLSVIRTRVRVFVCVHRSMCACHLADVVHASPFSCVSCV